MCQSHRSIHLFHNSNACTLVCLQECPYSLQNFSLRLVGHSGCSAAIQSKLKSACERASDASEHVPRPCGVISLTSWSTLIFSKPLLLITSVHATPPFVRGDRATTTARTKRALRWPQRHSPTFAVVLQVVKPATLHQFGSKKFLQSVGPRLNPKSHRAFREKTGQHTEHQTKQTRLSFSPVSTSFWLIVARTCSSRRRRSASVSAILCRGNTTNPEGVALGSRGCLRGCARERVTL